MSDTEQAAFFAAYDKATGGEPVVDAPEVAQEATAAAPEPVAQAETPVEAEAPVEAVPEVPEAPTYLPEDVRKHWATLPEDAREALSTSQKRMSERLAEAQKLVIGLDPIKGALVTAAKEMPHLANMKPAQIASEMLELAKVSAQFNRAPVETLVGLIDKHNMRDAIRQVLGGNPEAGQQTAAMAKEIADLKAQLSRVADPEYLREQVAAVSTQERVFETVTSFQREAEHWADVEDRIPMLIPAVKAKLGETAPPAAVLKEAYELAVNLYLPEKAKAATSAEPVAPPDPARAKAAIQAKAVNITGKVESKPRELSEREAFFAAYDRANRR